MTALDIYTSTDFRQRWMRRKHWLWKNIFRFKYPRRSTCKGYESQHGIRYPNSHRIVEEYLGTSVPLESFSSQFSTLIHLPISLALKNSFAIFQSLKRENLECFNDNHFSFPPNSSWHPLTPWIYLDTERNAKQDWWGKYIYGNKNTAEQMISTCRSLLVA